MVRLGTEVTLTFVLMKETVLESGKEALKPTQAEVLKKKQFIICKTNSKVNNYGHYKRFKVNNTEGLVVFVTERSSISFLSEYLPEMYTI